MPVEKLDELLVGAAVGDKKTTTVEIPKTYFREELQGRKVKIEIEIKDIKYLKPAEVDEHFLQRFERPDASTSCGTGFARTCRPGSNPRSATI